MPKSSSSRVASLPGSRPRLRVYARLNGARSRVRGSDQSSHASVRGSAPSACGTLWRARDDDALQHA
eukprot:1703725-Pyramimonas_sp.AAC.1